MESHGIPWNLWNPGILESAVSPLGQCVRPSVRLFDNSSQLHSIELKFCAQNCLINMSVEFEDEKDPSRNG